MISLMLWDLPGTPPASEGAVALWQQFLPDGAPEGMYSLPDEVHRDRDRLRASYLAWLHDVGQRRRRGRSLRDRMQIRPGLSYWWMAIPADFSLEPDSPAYKAVRLMAFTALADRLNAQQIVVTTHDRTLAQTIADWGNASNRRVTVVRPRSGDKAPCNGKGRRLRQAVYRAVPQIAAARVLASAVGLPKPRKKPQYGLKPSGITFVDYLAHLGPRSRLTGEFDSNYWGPLVPLLEERDEPITWLHLSGEYATPTIVRADEKRVATFNKGDTRQVHKLLHSHLTWGVLANSVRDYLRIVAHGLRAGPRPQLFKDSPTGLQLWTTCRGTFRDNFYGRTAMLNALFLNLLEAAVGALPHQRLGVYLFENQPWEMALQHAWLKAGHEQLVGVAHTTALFWNTRLFKDPRDLWSHEGAAPMPWPDMVAVNGPLMRSTCEAAGYAPKRLVDVEALRYLDLKSPRVKADSRDLLPVLVLGEYTTAAVQHMVATLNEALECITTWSQVTFRPHPAYSGPLPALDSRILIDHHSSVHIALNNARLTVTGPMSSVALDAALRGKRVIVTADPNQFLCSPADGIPQVVWARDAPELARLWEAEVSEESSAALDPSAIFTLGVPLVNWVSLLNVTEVWDNRPRDHDR